MNKKTSTGKYLIGIAVAVLLPLSFYILAKVLKKDKINMPRITGVVEKVDSALVNGKMTYDTTFHRAAELHAINQFGDHVALNKDLKDKIVVVNFFFTRCPSICPRLTRNMQLLQRAYRPTPMKKNDKSVQFISISLDPERDTVHALYEYASKFRADMNSWWFLTGNKQDIYNYARNELGAAAPQENSTAGDLEHVPSIILLDEDRNVRGFYDGLDSQAVAQLAFDIGQLNMEKKHYKK